MTITVWFHAVPVDDWIQEKRFGYANVRDDDTPAAGVCSVHAFEEIQMVILTVQKGSKRGFAN